MNTVRSTLTAFALLLLMPYAYATDDHFVVAGPSGAPVHLFNLPSCIPDCGREDQATLTLTSPVEDAVVAAINAATSSVAFSQYTFSRKPILDALIAAHARGVKVRGIVDEGQLRSLAEFCRQESCTGLPAPFSTPTYQVSDITARRAIAEGDDLYRNGSNSEKLALLLHNASDGSGLHFVGGRRLMHHKFVLVDDQNLLYGSGNWSSTAVSVNLENLNIAEKGTDPVIINAFSCMFEALWGPVQQRVSASAACQRGGVYFSPAGSSDVTVVKDLIQTIDTSVSSIEVSMHHLVHPEILSKLAAAAERGVKVRILTDDDHCITKYLPDVARIIRAGGQVRFVPTTCDIFQLSHNKFGVFDRRKVINGSGNWSIAGLERNFENFISTSEDLTTRAYSEAFDKLWALGVTKDACSCDPSTASCRERYCIGRPRP